MRTTKLFLLSLLVAAAAHAQMTTNLARGFDPEKVYQTGDVDNVNVFNGNLVINIPIGPTFSAGGNMSYGLHLIYNGNPWDYLIFNGLPQAAPSRFNNVAIGWQLTMGELVSPLDSLSQSLTENGLWLYQGPDGAERPIFPYLHQEESTYPAYALTVYGGDNGIIGYTRDSSYIRLMRLAPHQDGSSCRARYRLDFPDGNQHTFESTTLESCASQYGDETALHYRLVQMNDRFQNTVTLAYNNDPATLITITDSTGRYHTITLTPDPLFYEYAGSSQQRNRVTSVYLAAPPGQTVLYTFEVSGDSTQNTLASLPCADATIIGSNRTTGLRFLKSVTRPDGSQYSMLDGSGNLGYEVLETDSSGNHPCSPNAAHITRLNLPTGGYIEYGAGGRRFPSIPDPNTGHEPLDPDNPNFRKSAKFATSSIAVGSRTLHTGGTPDAVSTWLYDAKLENHVLYTQHADDGTITQSEIAQEQVVRVTDPASNTTAHYFSVYRQELEDEGVTACFTGGKFSEYGLPLTRRSPSSNGALLSTESYPGPCVSWSVSAMECPVITCATDSQGANVIKPMKATYVTYDTDSEAGGGTEHWDNYRNSREASTRTEFRTATGTVLSDTDLTRSDFDGLGHYRTELTHSTMAGSVDRTVTTHYNSNTNAGSYPDADPSRYMILTGSPWLTGLYDRIDTMEPGHTARQEFSFDTSTGFLLSRRTLKSGTGEGCNDLLAIFTNDGGGNVGHESYSGGDYHALSPCANFGPDYGITHTYQYGTLKNSYYDGTNFYFVDNDIDRNSGLVTASRDSARQTTYYTYDNLFRIKTEQQPAGGVKTTLTYSMSPPSVAADRTSLVGSPPATLTQQRFYYDGLGRLIQSKTLMPDGWSTIVREYDAASRLKSVSQPEYRSSGTQDSVSPAHKTLYDYDFLGRKTKTTSPDGTFLVQTYTGASSMDRETQNASGTPSPAGNKVTETYDGQGRLYTVTENSGTGGAAVTTTYGYDVGNHLASAQTTANGVTQTRSFTYDDYGLLASESHPELGATKSYTQYDGRGHAHHSAIGTGFALDFVFDPAERLTAVNDSNGNAVKEFVFGTSNPFVNGATNYEWGRLDSATRHNRLYDSLCGTVDVSVKDQFQYDANGRVRAKSTTIAHSVDSSVTQTLNQTYALDELGNPASVSYPTVGNAPVRSLSQTFANGLLTAIPSFTAVNQTITYHPTGMVKSVPHADGSTDTVNPDPNGMERPGSIAFDGWSSCSVSQPNVYAPSSVCPSSSGNVLTTAPTPDATVYTWSVTGGQITSVQGNGSYVIFTANGSGTVNFTLVVTNSCGTQSFSVPPITIGGPSATVSGNATITSGQSATIYAALTGTSPWTLHWSDGYTQTAYASPATRSVSPTTTTTYTVTSLSDGSCGSGSSSGSATITVQTPVSAPASVTATATATNSVTVSWSPVSGADSYALYRTDRGLVGTTTATSLVDSSVVASTAYVYYVHAKNGTYESGDSPRDLATTIIFTDDPQGKIRASDITTLRAAVNAVRARAGLGAYSFTDADASLPGLAVKGIHIQQLRDQLNNARGLLGLGAWTFTDPNVDPATNGGQHFPIKHVHITDLRGGVQ